ncbi:MAG: phosphoenolpyruvate mutase [Mariniblastus sp.]|nr:phosphoenolpyruvate mutase [Mariniblastus sp.]
MSTASPPTTLPPNENDLPMISKAAQLKKLINSDQLEFLMEAHNGISAKIVQETGFQGIWGSGLSISASNGVRDCNEMSWTQILRTAEFMSDATSIPILLDADTGFGNFNNVRRLVKKLEQIDVAGMCIEDKLFPKTNSFINGEQQTLADPYEFAGKIKAAKDTQKDPDFCVVARVESLIAGWGLSEALRRAEIYFEAGADAILIHSKKNTADQVIDFQFEWQNRCPLIIVPTMYHSTPTSVFKESQFSIAIWANQIMRSAITAMQKTASLIYEQESIEETESQIISVQEIFRLQDTDELKTAEDIYLTDTEKDAPLKPLRVGA